MHIFYSKTISFFQLSQEFLCAVKLIKVNFSTLALHILQEIFRQKSLVILRVVVIQQDLVNLLTFGQDTGLTCLKTCAEQWMKYTQHARVMPV